VGHLADDSTDVTMALGVVKHAKLGGADAVGVVRLRRGRENSRNIKQANNVNSRTKHKRRHDQGLRIP
jgi:hypothetical protein